MTGVLQSGRIGLRRTRILPEACLRSALARGVLLSTDGPFHDALKIKPPLVITDGEVDRALEVLDDALTEAEGSGA